MLFEKGRIMSAVAALVMIAGAAHAGTFPDYGYQPPANIHGADLPAKPELSENTPGRATSAFFKLLPAKVHQRLRTVAALRGSRKEVLLGR